MILIAIKGYRIVRIAPKRLV